MLRTVVDLAFLTLALVLVTILVTDRYDSNKYSTVSLEIQNLRNDVLSSSMKNFTYLESKINRVSEVSDSYQNEMNRRIKVLEHRMESLETRKRDNSRIINTNSVIANGAPVSSPVQQ